MNFIEIKVGLYYSRFPANQRFAKLARKTLNIYLRTIEL